MECELEEEEGARETTASVVAVREDGDARAMHEPVGQRASAPLTRAVRPSCVSRMDAAK